MDEHGEWTALVLDSRDSSIGSFLGNGDRAALAVDVLPALGEPEPELQARVVERARELVANAVRRGLLELEDEIAERRKYVRETEIRLGLEVAEEPR